MRAARRQLPRRPLIDFMFNLVQRHAMSSTIVSAKGQVVIPASIRKRLGIAAGSLVDVQQVGNRIEISLRKPMTRSSVEEGYGMLRYAGAPRRLAQFDVAAEMRREREIGRR